jgi:phosphatidylglycerol:prolipoprotein diacylglycerol transferase
MAQVVSLVGIGLGLAGLAWLYIYRRNLPDVAPLVREEREERVEASKR